MSHACQRSRSTGARANGNYTVAGLVPMWQQNYEPLAGSLGASAAVAALPILVLFYMLGVKRKPTWIAATSALGAAVIIALVVYRMPVQMALASMLYGAAFGIFPIAWICFSSILLYRVAVDTGKFEIIKDSVGSLTNDRRLQAMFIAFSFGAFIEGAAGFGAPVAVAGAMLAGLGFSPFYAAGICLLANTTPVAFGSIGIPVTTLANVTGLPVLALSAMVGRLCSMVSVLDPRLPGRRDGRADARARSPPGDPGVRPVVRGDAALCLELLGPRAHRHHEFAHLHRRDGLDAEVVETQDRAAARGRPSGRCSAEATSPRRTPHRVAAVHAPRGIRVDLGQTRCEDGHQQVDRWNAAGVPASQFDGAQRPHDSRTAQCHHADPPGDRRARRPMRRCSS